MENDKTFKQLIKESTFDNSWKEEFQFQSENEEAEDLYFEISLRIIERLEELGWKKSDLAEKLGVSNQYISKILKTIQNPSITTIIKIQNALEIKLIGIPNQQPKTQSKNQITVKFKSPGLMNYPKSYLGEIIYPSQTHLTSKWQENQKSSYQCDC